MAMPFRVSHNPAPKVLGPTRAERKHARQTAQDTAERACYRAVDARDGRCCRVCHRLVSTSALSMLDRAEHHHIIPRSRGGAHETSNVITLCSSCHDAIKGTLKLEGNADSKDDRGRLCGVTVTKLKGEVWKVWKVV